MTEPHWLRNTDPHWLRPRQPRIAAADVRRRPTSWQERLHRLDFALPMACEVFWGSVNRIVPTCQAVTTRM